MFSKTQLMVMLGSAAALGCSLNGTRKDVCNVEGDCLEGLSCVNHVCSDTPNAGPDVGNQFTDTDTCEPAGPVQIGCSVYYNYIANGEPSSTACWNPARITFVTDQTSCGPSSPTHDAFQFTYSSSFSQQFTILPDFGSSNFILSFFVDLIDPHRDPQNVFFAEVWDGNTLLAQYDLDGSQVAPPPCSRIDLSINQNLDGHTITVRFSGRNGYPDSSIRVWGISFFQGPGGYCPPVRGDFNADGKSDLVWRNGPTGTSSVWMMNGTSIGAGSGTTSLQISTSFVLAGVGDFNGDRKADLVWRNDTTGDTILWLMNGINAVSGSGLLATMPSPWQVVGVGDFNGDGRADLLWRNMATGVNSIWFLNGTTVLAGSGTTLQISDLNWSVGGIGDFNHDGRSDILWRNNTTGISSIWMMNGTSLGSDSGTTAIPIGTAWRPAAVADLNGDGFADIVWRNVETGQNVLWLMNGTNLLVGSSDILAIADLNWNVVATGDFNGDGRDDLVWRNNTTGTSSMWLMNGTSIGADSGTLSDVAPPWIIAGPK